MDGITVCKMEDRYRWQEECLDSWEANDNRGIVQAVTGAGKTIFALKAVQRLREKCGESLWTAIVVPTRALMIQWNRIDHGLSTGGRGS